MTHRWLLCCVMLSVALCARPANACLWDYDTLEMERQEFPTALELITGKFLRHSYEYYRWRIEDRTKRLKSEPKNLALYDDLAVAYDNIGEHDKAIETILKKEQIKPGLYETYANLGTFYIHSGRLKEGLKHIKWAIAINPGAHFGREIYQKLLVEYVMLATKGKKIRLPLSEQLRQERNRTESNLPWSFADFVITSRNMQVHRKEEIARAVNGVLGMMRFGKHDSPILLEALGDLLRASRDRKEAKRLAARAYLNASFAVSDPKARAKYREMAEGAIKFQTKRRHSEDQLDLIQLERRFKAELKQAEEWYARVLEDEARWVKAGGDVDEQFRKKYYEEPAIGPDYSDGPPDPYEATNSLFIGLAGVVVLILFAAGFWFLRRLLLVS